MTKKFKRHVVLPAALLLYLVVMAVMAYPKYEASGKWGEYFLVIGISLLVLVMLFIILKRRNKMRSRFSDKELEP